MEHSIVNAVGVWFFSLDTQRYLYLMRRDNKHPMTWGLPGGKQEPGETLLGCMERECHEELGFMPEYVHLAPLEKFTSADNTFAYHTFFCCVHHEFQPILNHEHLGYAWIETGAWPKPMHPGLWNTVNFDVVQEKINIIRKLVHTSQCEINVL